MNKIAFLNDGLRRTFARGRIVMTAAVAALPEEMLAKVLDRVRRFDEFTSDNDPYGEHDFGSFAFQGLPEKVWFKVDLYEELGVKGTDGEPVVSRVLTIMLAEEY